MTPVTQMRRLSIRARLTLVYGGLVLLTGVLLLAVTALLVSQRLSGTAALTTGVRDLNGTGQTVDPGTVAGEVPAVRTGDGEVVTVQDLPGFVHRSAMESLLTQGGIALLVVTA